MSLQPDLCAADVFRSDMLGSSAYLGCTAGVFIVTVTWLYRFFGAQVFNRLSLQCYLRRLNCLFFEDCIGVSGSPFLCKGAKTQKLNDLLNAPSTLMYHLLKKKYAQEHWGALGVALELLD